MYRTIVTLTRACALGVGITAGLMATVARSDEFPTKDFTFIVHGSAGGGSDIIARTVTNIIAQKKLIPTKVIVENRPGGSGVVAYSYVAARAGNPYILGTMSGSFFTTAIGGESTVSYKDFTPIAAIAQDSYVLCVRGDANINSMADLISKKEVNVGSTGVITDHSILASMLGKKTGLKTKVVPFGGDGEVLAALLGGHIDVQFGNPSEILSQVQAGRLKALAVSTAKRISALPDVPTFQEQGIDIEYGQLRAFVMPKNLTPAAVAFMENVFKQVAESPEWKAEYLDRNNALPVFLGSADLQNRFAELNEMYAGFMKDAGLAK